MRRPGARQRRIVILMLAVLAFGIAYYGGNRYSRNEGLPAITGILLRPALPVPEFELSDQRGEVFSNRELADHWSLLLLDPASDPSALSRLARIHNQLAVSPDLQRQVRFIHIPRQPDSAYSAADFGSRFFTLLGESSQTQETFARFGIDTQQAGFTLFLVGPDAELHAMYTSDQDAATIAADLTTLMNSLDN